nr:hypothetical protein BaRGS_011083 [Batillaria attramentaria]
MSMQAKRVCLDNIRLSASGKLDAENLANYCWNDVRLPQYISAFAKIRSGGSIFLGVMEEDKPKLWIQVQSAEVDGLFTVHDSDFKVWKENEGNEDSKMVYHVAREDAVPDKKTKPSGKFMCQGVCLTKNEQKLFRKKIQEKIRTDMLWLGLSKPINPVTIHFHGVENGPADMCVIEIQVDFFHGVAFHHNKGPVSYKCFGPTGQIEQIQLEVWVHENGGTMEDWAEEGKPYLNTQTPEVS